MRRHPDDRTESAQEVVRTHRRHAGEVGKRERFVRVAFDPMQRRADPSLIGAAWRRWPAGRPRERRGNCTGKTERNFLKLRRIAVVPRCLGCGDDRQ